jgi:magnesium-transporting ATPase (P-type)
MSRFYLFKASSMACWAIWMLLLTALTSDNRVYSLRYPLTSTYASVASSENARRDSSRDLLRDGDIGASTLSYNASATDAGSLTVSDLLQILQTNPQKGLSTSQSKERLNLYGPNNLTQSTKPNIWQLLAEQFDDRLVQILVFVAIVSAAFSVLEHTGDKSLLQSFVEPIVIVAILVLNAAVGVWQCQSASDSLDALQDMQPTLATVIRNGQVISELPASELVPGDIIQLRVGNKIPADARLLELQSSTLQVDESSLTGESETVSKLPGMEGKSMMGDPVQNQVGMIFSGTMITSGNGLAVVTQTGMDTQVVIFSHLFYLLFLQPKLTIVPRFNFSSERYKEASLWQKNRKKKPP